MLLSVSLALAALAGRTLALDTVSVKGSKFFKSDGSQFYIKGIAYQLSENDPLADGDQCRRDVELMKDIGTNALRIYHVEADLDHDDCMQVFSDAGIYTFIDLDTFDTYLYSDEGGGRWTQEQYDAFSRVMDTFHAYDNVAGFFVANELLNFGAASVGAPYIKAAAVDMKNYRDNQGYRDIPIGYSAADIPDLRPNLQNYMACGEPDEALDFYSLNAYEWCGESTFETSGYSALQANASDYNIPIWFSEVGCNAVKPRTFGDQEVIFSEPMVDTWSGSMIYEWIQEANDYGLVSYGPPAGPSPTDENVVAGFTRGGTPTPANEDFENLSSQWAKVTPTGVRRDEYQPSLSPVACPDYTEGLWMVEGTELPTIGAAYTGAARATSSSPSPSSASAGSSSDAGVASSTSPASSGDAATSNAAGSGDAGSGDASSSAAGNTSIANTDTANADTDSTSTAVIAVESTSNTVSSASATDDPSTQADEATASDDSNDDADSDSTVAASNESAAGLGYRVSAAAAGLGSLLAFIVVVL